MKWYAQKAGNDYQGLVVDEKTGKDIAVSYDRKHTPILAAAPSLLEALKQIIWKLNRNEKTPDYSGPARITREDVTIRNAERLIYEIEDNITNHAKD